MYFSLGQMDWERNIFGRIAANSFFIQCNPPIIAMFVYISRYKAHVVYGEAYGEACQVVSGSAERGGAEAVQLRPSLHCLTLTNISRP